MVARAAVAAPEATAPATQATERERDIGAIAAVVVAPRPGGANEGEAPADEVPETPEAPGPVGPMANGAADAPPARTAALSTRP